MTPEPTSQPDTVDDTNKPSGGLITWFADHPWTLVVAAFLTLISVWVVFFTLAFQHPVRDILKNPFPNPPPTAVSTDSMP